MSTRRRSAPPPEPTTPPSAQGAKTRYAIPRHKPPPPDRPGEAEVEAAAENLELADKLARDLDEPGRFGEAQAAALFAPVVDAAWQPRARNSAQLLELVDRLSDDPGVYVMRDRKGTIVYVGKARRLRARVRQYFNGTDTRMFVPLLANLLGDIETVVTSNDKEALLLENNLIKKHKPRFNVKLRDDKQFLVLRLDPKADWPRLELVRRMRKDGAQYFGPYHSASSARHTLRVVNRYFKLRTCTDYTLKHRTRPCLQHQIGRCPAPCVYPVDRAMYAGQVKHVGQFLDGRHKDLVHDLKSQMEAAAEAMEFETAARLRDQLSAIETSLETQQVVDTSEVDQDVIGMYREGGQVEFVVMHVRQGKLLGTRSFSVRGMELPDAEVLGSFLLAFYDDAPTIPDELILPAPLVEDDEEPLRAWLREQTGRKVAVLVPERGDRKKLVALAQKNATSSFATRRNRQEDSDQALLALKQRLGLTRLPRVIECYDISHIQGSDTVASMVVFVDGAAARKRYRSFRIRGLDGLAQGDRQNDDFASMAEVLGRRVRRALAGGGEKDPAEELEEGEEDTWTLPDLMVIDGGKGQLGRVLTMLRDLGVTVGAGGIDVVSLAKERKVEIGRGKAALAQLREHRERMRGRPGALRAEEPLPALPDFGAQLAAEAAARASAAGSVAGGDPGAEPAGAAGRATAVDAGSAPALVGSASGLAAASGASAVRPVEAAAGAGAASAAGTSEAAASGARDVASAAGEVRPGETYQDFVLNAEEDAGDDGTEIRPERVFVPGAKEAIRLRPGTSELYLMTQLRDEAHRFAITHHRKRRGKRALHSALDDIPGVGPALKKALLQAFGSVAGIAAADDAALTAIKGVGPALVKKLREALGST